MFKKGKSNLSFINKVLRIGQNEGVKKMDFKKAEELRNRLMSHFAAKEPNLSVVLERRDMRFEDDEGWHINIF